MKAGERYVSKVWISHENHQPITVKITKVTSSAIYYRPDYGLHNDGTEWLGSCAWITPDQIAKYLVV